MKNTLLSLIPIIFLASCAVTEKGTSADSVTKVDYPQYVSSRVVNTQFPPLASDPRYVDVSKRQLFATLPYFKGDSFSERLSYTGLGTASHGSLKKHYFPRLGTPENPDTFTFNNNGFGHKVVIQRGFNTNLADFNITITDPATNQELLKVYAVYGSVVSDPGAISTDRQWFIKPL